MRKKSRNKLVKMLIAGSEKGVGWESESKHSSTQIGAIIRVDKLVIIAGGEFGVITRELTEQLKIEN